MAGAMRKMGIYLGLVEDNPDGDDRDYDGDYDFDRSGESSSDYGSYSGGHGSGHVTSHRSESGSDYDDYPAFGESAERGRDHTASSRGSYLDRPRPEADARDSYSAEPTRARGLTDARPSGAPLARTAVAERPAGSVQSALAVDRPSTTPSPRGPVVDSQTRSALAQIVTLHPRTYNEARVIGENFRDGVPVIMNLTEMDDSDAKRLVDFAAGLTFGLRGSIDRVTNRVFLLSPRNVDVTAEEKARLVEGGFFNQS